MHDKPDNIRLDLFHHNLSGAVGGGDVSGKLDKILCLLEQLFAQGEIMSVELDALELEVARNTDAAASAVVLIKGLADQLRAAGNDPAKIRALEASIRASADGLAAAVLENTDSGPIDDGGGFDPPVDPNFPGGGLPGTGGLPGDPGFPTDPVGGLPGTGGTFPNDPNPAPGFPSDGGVLPNDPFPGTPANPNDGTLEQDPNAPLGVMRRRTR